MRASVFRATSLRPASSLACHSNDVLSDPNLRAAYDRGGLEALQGGGGMNPEDLFETLFGGGFGGFGGFDFGGGGGPRKGGPRRGRGEDTIIPLDVTLEDLYNGKTVKMAMEKNVICGQCTGSGAKGNAKPKKCGKCEGKGFTYANNAVSVV